MQKTSRFPDDPKPAASRRRNTKSNSANGFTGSDPSISNSGRIYDSSVQHVGDAHDEITNEEAIHRALALPDINGLKLAYGEAGHARGLELAKNVHVGAVAMLKAGRQLHEQFESCGGKGRNSRMASWLSTYAPGLARKTADRMRHAYSAFCDQFEIDPSVFENFRITALYYLTDAPDRCRKKAIQIAANEIVTEELAKQIAPRKQTKNTKQSTTYSTNDIESSNAPCVGSPGQIPATFHNNSPSPTVVNADAAVVHSISDASYIDNIGTQTDNPNGDHVMATNAKEECPTALHSRHHTPIESQADEDLSLVSRDHKESTIKPINVCRQGHTPGEEQVGATDSKNIKSAISDDASTTQSHDTFHVYCSDEQLAHAIDYLRSSGFTYFCSTVVRYAKTHHAFVISGVRPGLPVDRPTDELGDWFETDSFETGHDEARARIEAEYANSLFQLCKAELEGSTQ